MSLLQQKIYKLSKKIDWIFDSVVAGQWGDAGLSSLLKELREYVAQIQDESGDKVHKFKGEGFANQQHFYLGDSVVNKIADEAVKEAGQTVRVSGDRFKKNRLSDSEDSLPRY